MLDLLLVKNDETKEYERKIKITDHRIASDIIEPLISQTYLKFNIQRDEKDNTFYKHSLYILLYILQRLHGKKSIDKMLNIDEAQDITINEYKVIKDANENATFNLYGDTLQLLYQGRGIEKWEEIQFLFDKPFKLNQNYRNVSNITKFCNHELGIEMESMSIDGDEVDYINIEKFNELPKEYVLIIKNLDTLKTLNLKLEEYNIISNKSDLMKSNKINIFTVEMVKGMEFSKVVVYANDMKKREKYIAYTRALNTLKILVD